MKIVAISDTHNRHTEIKIPECDLLIHSGDMTGRGELRAVLNCYKWLSEQPAKEIVTTPGNHELGMEKNLLLYLEEINKIAPSIHILIDKTIEINGIKIHGSPITPFFFDWSWNRFRGPDIKKHWDLIPDDVQILVTHGPPHGTLDVVYQADGVTPRERAGCADLEEAIRLRLRKLRLHVFGHIHCSSGMDVKDGVTYVNASICDEAYYPANEPRVIEFGDDEFSK